jgi:uncharacterized protein YbjT (DUF2867 family)
MAVRAIDHYEEYYKVRARARRPDDAQKHRRSIDVVISNLAYAVLVPPQPSGRVALRLGNQRRGMTRYENPALGRNPSGG